MSKKASEMHAYKFHGEQIQLATDLYTRVEGSGQNLKKVSEDLRAIVIKRRAEIKEYYASLRRIVDE